MSDTLAAAASDRLMHAVVSTEGGPLTATGALADTQLPVPTPGDRDLLVRITAISVNPIDTKQRALGNEIAGGRILGWDAVGIVEAVGPDATTFTPGDRVYYSGSVDRPGTYAEYGIVDERLAARAPRALGDPDAAALPLTAITAWEALFEKLGVPLRKKGEADGPPALTATAPSGNESSTNPATILILGGAGGVASIAIQLLRELTDVTVIASASRDETRDWVLEMGAHHVVDHSAEDLCAQVLALAPHGVDYVLSTNSAGLVDFFFQVVRPFGKIVAIDNPVALDLLPLKRKSISWHWEFMFTKALFGWGVESQGAILARVAELVDAGRVRSTARTVLHGITAANLRKAHSQIESGSTIGKMVLVQQ